jgi:GT2 family glycosyltransferase
MNQNVQELQSPPTRVASGQPALTIVIVSWNSRPFLGSCLRSIQRTGPDLNVSVIIVDNASSDGSAEFVQREFPEALLIRSGANLGFGRGNNLARSHVQPGYVLFLNPDTLLQENSLQRMVDFLQTHSKVGAVGCKMIFPDGEVADQNLQWFPTPLTEFVRIAFLTYGVTRKLEGLLPINDPLKSGIVEKLYGGCFVIRTPVLEQVGWFDERFFMYAEDVDLSRRIREAGWELYYLSDAAITHAAGGATKKAGSDFSILMGCESMGKLIAKYQGKWAGMLYKACVFLASVIRLTFLAPLLVVSPALPANKRISCREAARNCALRIKWALRLRSVFIPE